MVTTKLRHISNLKGDPGAKGAKGDTGTIAGATAVTIPADQSASVTMTGPETAKVANFRIPRGLPGMNAVAADEAVAAYLAAADSETGGRARSLIVDETLPISMDDVRFDQFPTRTAETVSINNRTYSVSPIVTLPSGDYVAVWYNELRHPVVGKFSQTTRSWETTDLHYIFSNPMGSPAPSDGHNTLVIARDGDGYFHLMGNMHATVFRYLRSAEPGVIDRWVIMPTAEWSINSSYPWVRTISGGDLLAMYRAGGTNAGDWFVRRYNLAAKAWGAETKVFEGRSLVPNASAYPNSVILDGNSLHVFFMWRYATTEDSNEDFAYVRSDDLGATWKRIDGAAQSIPINQHTDEPKFLTGSLGFMNQCGAAVFDGLPHAIVRQTGTNAQLRWIRWDGAAWQNTVIADGSSGTLGRPALVVTPSGVMLALFRRGARIRARQLLPALGAEFDLVPFTTGNTEAGWEPAFDADLMASSGVLRAVVSSTIAGAANSPTTPVSTGGWGGVLTVRITEQVTAKLATARNAVALATPTLPAPAPDVATVPDSNRVSFLSTADLWGTVGGHNRWDSGVPVLPRSRFHGVRAMFTQQSRISHAAVKVITAGDGDSRVQVVIAEPDGRVVGRSEMAAATSTGVKQVEFTARASVRPGVVYYVGVIVWGGTTGVGVVLTRDVDQMITGSSAAAVLDNTLVGRREGSDGFSDNTTLNALVLSPFAPVVALRAIAPVAT